MLTVLPQSKPPLVAVQASERLTERDYAEFVPLLRPSVRL
jgi:hypothetical protein